MDEWKKIFRICIIDLRKITMTPRFYMAFVGVFFAFLYSLAGIRDFCSAVGMKCSPWIFPLLTESSGNQMFIILGSLLLFCDAPFLNFGSGWQIQRAGKSYWFWGKMLYIWLLSFIYAAGLSILPVMMALPAVEWNETWGKILGSLAQPNIAQQFGIMHFNYEIIAHYNPAKAFMPTLTAVWLNATLIGICNYTFNFYLKKGIGATISVMIGLSPLLIIRLAHFGIGYYLAPPLWMNLANYKWQSYGFGVSFTYVYGILLGTILICTTLSQRGIRTIDLHFSDEV